MNQCPLPNRRYSLLYEMTSPQESDGMRVLFVSSEVYPLAKTGGLADVSEALPRALARLGADIRVLMPGYACALEQVTKARAVADLSGLMGIADGRLLSARIPSTDLPVWLVDAPELYGRGGGLYQTEDGEDWPDNARRFAYLSHVAARLATGAAEAAWVPDVVHTNDWHAGLVPLFLSQGGGPRPGTIFTMHNMAFQGLFPASALPGLGLTEDSFALESLEYYGQISFLKAGIATADRLTTVSPSYAREILTPEFGCGLEGLLRERAAELTGILNGADYTIWDPAHDPFLASGYDAAHLTGKKSCKAALQRELGLLEAPETPILAFISRLTKQKMADTLLEILPWLTEKDMQLALLSDGDHELERKFVDAARVWPTKIAVRIGYQEPLAHRMQAGADILLAPARFEPCGLSQLYAMRYGTLPVVRATGGLVDTVTDTTRTTIADASSTGFAFTDSTSAQFKDAIGRALALYREPLAWRRLQIRAMNQDFSWNCSAARYLALYETLAGSPETREEVLPALPLEAAYTPAREQATA